MDWTQILVAWASPLAAIFASIMGVLSFANARATKLAQADLLRNEITKIYYKRQKVGKLYEYERKSLDLMYDGYAKTGLNTFVHDIYQEMRTWTIVGNGEILEG